MLKKICCTSALLLGSMLCAENIVRNAGFDFSWDLNGYQMLVSDYDVARMGLSMRSNSGWMKTPFEGWWLHAENPQKINMRSVNGYLRISGTGTLYSDVYSFPHKKGVLSCDIRTTGAYGTLFFESLRSNKDKSIRDICGSREQKLPLDTFGHMIHFKIPFDNMEGDLAALRLDFKGNVEIDNVQIEEGLEATDFELTPSDWLDLRLGNFTTEEFPRFYEGVSPKELTVRNRARQKISGSLRLFLDSWNHAGKTLLSETQISLEPNRTFKTELVLQNLKPDAYVLIAEFYDQEKDILITKEIYDPKRTGNGYAGKNQFSARNGLRFAIFKRLVPEKIWGVGNAMFCVNDWYAGHAVDDYSEYSGMHVCLSGEKESDLFNAAVAKAPIFGSPGFFFDAAAEDTDLNNPAAPGSIDYFNLDAKRVLKKRGRELGRIYSMGPGFAGMKLRNESPYLYGGATCPTLSADRAFREWCRKRYKTLAAINTVWHKDYKSWSEVEQIVSAKMAGEQTGVRKTGADAVDWYANMGNFTPHVQELMYADPGRAMDWCRWRSESSVEAMMFFHDLIKERKCETLVGNNFCWPNFWSQIVMPFWRKSGNAMLDLQYTAQMSIEYGNCDEMLDILEMAESTIPGKPIWGIEIYVQPSFPAEFTAFQNWGMVAHGITNNLVFAWRPYADVGPKAFKDGPGAWKKENAPQMWFMIDTDGTKLPAFDCNKRSIEEISAYHSKYNAWSIQRPRSRIGYFLPNETSEFIIMTTANEPYKSALQNCRSTIAGQLRMNGVSMNYLDTPALRNIRYKDYDTILVPPSPVMDDDSIQQLVKFAGYGGTVVLLGPCAAFDPCLNLRDEFADGMFCRTWQTPAEWADFRVFLQDFGTYPAKGVSRMNKIPAIPGGAEITDKYGELIGWSIPFKRGKIIQFFKWPCRYEFKTVQPTPELRDMTEELIREANLPRKAYWTSGELPEDKGYGRPGNGAPCVEVVVREKRASELFLFVLNQGGEGSGIVHLPEGTWTVTDILTGASPFVENNELPLKMKPFGYRIFRLKSNDIL